MKNILLLCLIGSLLVSTLKCDDNNFAEDSNDQVTSDDRIYSPMYRVQFQIEQLVTYRVILSDINASLQQNITSLLSQINSDSSSEDLKRINIDLSQVIQDEEAIQQEYEQTQQQIEDLIIDLFQNQL